MSSHLGILISVIAVSLGLAACGGGGAKSTTSSTTTTASSAAGAGRRATVSSGPVRGTLRAINHSPQVGKNWPYSVHVTDATGKPLNGTVDIEFLFGRQVVGHDSPPTHPVRHGRWHDYLTYPAPAAGQSLTFRAVVHTRLGSITLDWPIKVRP